jgi:hypothetical protein
MPTSPPPRRKWNITRWLLVFALVAMAWSGWRAYTFRSALSRAKALGWTVEYTDPVERIRNYWKAAFRIETWLDGVNHVSIPTGEAFERNLAIVHRLNSKFLQIDSGASLRDLSALEPLDRLQTVWLIGCTGLTNVDALKNLSALRGVWLIGCTGLTNLDGLKNLSALKALALNGCTGLTNVDGLKHLSGLNVVNIEGCTGLTKESVAALKAALPNATVMGP